MMSQEEVVGVAHEFLRRLSGAGPDEVAELFEPDVEFEIAGDIGSLPWIGRKRGRQAVVDFVHDTRSLLEPIRCQVLDVVANSRTAVILCDLASRVKRTHRVVETAIALVLTIDDGRISGFRVLEDSFAVSRASR
jgi:ketosteroid isomerase-like protein